MSDKPVAEFPKYVMPHESFVVRKDGSPGHVSVPLWPEFHVGRDGSVTVLVTDADEEAKATAPAEAPKDDKPQETVDPT